MKPGLNLESLVIWTGGWDRWCKVVEVRAQSSGKLPKGPDVWMGELYYGKPGDATMAAVVKGLGKGFTFHP